MIPAVLSMLGRCSFTPYRQFLSSVPSSRPTPLPCVRGRIRTLGHCGAGSTKSQDKLWRNLNDETSEPVRPIAYVLTACIGGKYLIKTSGLRCDWDAYNSMPHCLLSRGSHPHHARGTRRKMTLSQLCKMCVNCVLVAILSFAHAESAA